MKSDCKFSLQKNKLFINEILTQYLNDSVDTLQKLKEEKIKMKNMCEEIISPIMKFRKEIINLLEKYENNHLIFLNKIKFKQQVLKNEFKNINLEDLLEEEFELKKKLESESNEMKMLINEYEYKLRELSYIMNHDSPRSSYLIGSDYSFYSSYYERSDIIRESLSLSAINKNDESNFYISYSNSRKIQSTIFNSNKSNFSSKTISPSEKDNEVINLVEESEILLSTKNTSEQKKESGKKQKQYLKIYLGDIRKKKNKITQDSDEITSKNPLRLIFTHTKNENEIISNFIENNFYKYFYKSNSKKTVVCGFTFNFRKLIREIRKNKKSKLFKEIDIFIHKNLKTLMKYMTKDSHMNMSIENEESQNYPNKNKIIPQLECLSPIVIIEIEDVKMVNENYNQSNIVVDINKY